jgi:tetratricopeptide (TPR) repeat protein
MASPTTTMTFSEKNSLLELTIEDVDGHVWHVNNLPQTGDEATPLLEKVENQSRQSFSLSRLLGKLKKLSTTPDPGSKSEKVHNLVWDVSKQGKYENVEKMNCTVLSEFKRVIQKRLCTTLHSLQYYLAREQFYWAYYKKAEEMHRRVLSGRENMLGNDHPDTLRSVQYVGYSLSKQCKHEEAEEMYRRALKGRENVLGKKPPDTLVSMCALALALGVLSCAQETKDMDLRKGNLRMLDHIGDLEQLARMLKGRRTYEVLAKMSRELLQGREEMHGDEDQRPLFCVLSLVRLLWSRRKLEDGVEVGRLVLKGMEKLSGDNFNTHTLDAICYVVRALVRWTKYKQAAKLNREELRRRE